MRPDGGATQNWKEIKAVISDLIIKLNYMFKNQEEIRYMDCDKCEGKGEILVTNHQTGEEEVEPCVCQYDEELTEQDIIDRKTDNDLEDFYLGNRNFY